MKISNLIISALIIFSFIGCEKEEDPLVRVSNKLSIYTEVELKKTDGYTKLFEEVDAGYTTDYPKYPMVFISLLRQMLPLPVLFKLLKTKNIRLKLISAINKYITSE